MYVPMYIYPIHFPQNRSGFLDQEWFTFETANTLVVGWAGGPERQQTREGGHRTTMAQLKDQAKSSGIEIADTG